jgi:NAD(P)-dependent dehydrogenase (short-subunit alcohol dehydrogenase family)
MTANLWATDSIPDLSGKRIIVTGANSGIGYEAALALAAKNAAVILAVRRLEQGEAAAAHIRQTHPQTEVGVMALDLADLDSIRRFATIYLERYTALDVLINNAGVMALPPRRTADGFEMQFGTNHLGHFALTGLLLPAILAAPAARVVTVSSAEHLRGKIDFDDLQAEKRYGAWRAYRQSKLANVLFAYELHRRFERAGAAAMSVACHPGYAATNLQTAGPVMAGSRVMETVMRIANRLVAQSAAMGALPTLYAALAPEVNGCDYIGPMGLGGMYGYPGKVRSLPASYDPDLARRLWEVSEQLTAVRYSFAGAH